MIKVTIQFVYNNNQYVYETFKIIGSYMIIFLG